MHFSVVFSAFVAVCLTSSVYSKVTSENCEVCVKFVGKLIESMPSEDLTSMDKVKEKFVAMCSKARKSDERFCYYLGGLKTSATYIVNELTKPVSWGMPPEKVCEKLKAKDSQICELKYEKLVDLKTVNFKKLRVKELRKILDAWGEECVGCTEKSDYVKLLKEKMRIHDPKAAEARKDEL